MFTLYRNLKQMRMMTTSVMIKLKYRNNNTNVTNSQLTAVNAK